MEGGVGVGETRQKICQVHIDTTLQYIRGVRGGGEGLGVDPSYEDQGQLA